MIVHWDSLVTYIYAAWALITLSGITSRSLLNRGVSTLFRPSWPLFAPNPIQHNFYVLYRQRADDSGAGTPWIQLNQYRNRSTSSAIWNPWAFEYMFLINVCQALCLRSELGARSEKTVRLCRAFLAHWTFLNAPIAISDCEILIIRVDVDDVSKWDILFHETSIKEMACDSWKKTLDT